jgi:cytoskeletal protein CcmA (bactofilin family)
MIVGVTILFVVAALVISIPAWPAFTEWRVGRDKQPLTISDTYADDHHIVAEAFGKEVGEHLKEAVQMYMASGGQPGMGHTVLKNHYDIVGPHSKEAPDFQNGVLPLVLVRNTLTQWPAKASLLRQTYVAGAFECGSGARIERLYVDGDVYLGEETVVSEWAHARRDLRALAGCELNGSVVAHRMVQVWPGCHFERLSAGEIRFGDEWHWPEGPVASQHKAQDIPPLFRLNGRAERQGSGHVVAGDLSIPPSHSWSGDLIVLGKLRLGRDARIQGSVKAEGGVVLEPGSSVVGQLFSDTSIEIRSGARVSGTAATEGDLRLRWGSEVGSPDAPSTATGQVVLMEQGARVFGLVVAVEEGRVTVRTVARIAA